MVAWPCLTTMKPNSNVRRRSRPLPLQQEEMAVAETVAAVGAAVAAVAAVEVEVAEEGTTAAEVVATAPAQRSQLR